MNHRNPDDEPAVAGVSTTTELPAQMIADRLAGIVVTPHESHVASAGYERAL